MQAAFDWDEIGILIGILNTKGVRYLIGEGAPLGAEEENIDPVTLIQRLAACNYPLVESSAISLFILHPEFAPAVAEALQKSKDEVAENIAVLTLATLYLQQWWLFRLAFVLGQLPSFPKRHLSPSGRTATYPRPRKVTAWTGCWLCKSKPYGKFFRRESIHS